MRLTASLVLAAVAAGAATGKAQVPIAAKGPALDLLERPARLSIENVRLIDALNTLRDRAGVPVAFSPDFLPSDRRVNCACEDLSVRAALGMLLRGTGLTFTEYGRQVLIEPADPAPPPFLSARAAASQLASLSREPAQWSLDLSPAPPAEQQRVITGVVADERGRAVSGASVALAGSAARALTDEAGRFRLEGPANPEVTLQVTAIGYRPLTQSVRVGEAPIRLVLVEAAVKLDELVVTGTAGETQKRAIGNAVSTVAASKVVELSPVSTVAQLITGRAPGALVQLANGTIGSGARIKLRGSSSLGLNDQPIVYVDGVRVDSKVASGAASDGFVGNISRLNDFNPADIESIEIIKGPAAATLYGTEAANGVIQIITKRGTRRSGARWDASLRQGANWFQNPRGRFDPAYGVDAGGQTFSVNPYQLALDQGEHPFRTGYLQGYEGSVAGGVEKVQYYLGGGYARDQGIESNNAQTQYHGRVNLGLNPSEKLDVNTNLAYVNQATDMSAGGFFGGPLFALTLVRPALLNTPRQGWIFGSPTQWERAFQFPQRVNRLTASVQLKHRPLPWLSHRLNVGLDQLLEDNALLVEKMPADLVAAFGSGLGAGLQVFDSRRATNSTIDWGASAVAKLSGAVQSETSVGLQYFRRTEKDFTGSASQFPAAGLTALSAGQIRDAGETFLANATVGLYLQEQVGWNGRLYLTGAVRGDDNSAFGKNFKAAYYPKASATWVISEEPFWKVRFLNTLRIRGAFGQSGQQPQAFDALRTFQPVAGGGGVPGVTPSSIGNPDLKPERGTEIELGFDAGLLKDRVGLQFTVYRKKTTDAILQRAVKPSLGFPGAQLVNVGELTNRGLEALLNARVVESRVADLDLVVNVGANDNQVVHVGNAQGFIPVAYTGFAVTNQRQQDGYPVAGYFDKRVVSATLNPTTKRAENILCDNGSGGGVDCAQAPAVYLGRSVPTAFGSVSPTVTLFDRLRIYALVDFQTGYKRVDTEHTGSCNLGTCPEVFFPERFDITKVAAQQIFAYTYFGLESASFARLREVSATYTAPERLARWFGAKAAAVTLVARNLKTWTGFPGLDPEAFIVSEQFSGSNSRAMPQLASVMARVSVTF